MASYFINNRSTLKMKTTSFYDRRDVECFFFIFFSLLRIAICIS